MKKEYDIAISLRENLEEDAKDQELRDELRVFNGRVYHVVEDDDRRTINNNSTPVGNALEMDITNIILLTIGRSSLVFNKTPYFDVEIIGKD